jgi:T-complex protein 1 subunit epsilon
MRENFVLDPLIGKRQQFLLATQLCRMVLKVNDGSLTQDSLTNFIVIISGQGEE